MNVFVHYRGKIVQRYFLFALLGLGCLSPTYVHAVESKIWVAQGCGSEPMPPSVDVSTVDKYNASVDAVTHYENTARDYNSCVSRKGVADETAISNDARKKMNFVHAGSSAVQQRISKNFVDLTNALQQGNANLQKMIH